MRYGRGYEFLSSFSELESAVEKVNPQTWQELQLDALDGKSRSHDEFLLNSFLIGAHILKEMAQQSVDLSTLTEYTPAEVQAFHDFLKQGIKSRARHLNRNIPFDKVHLDDLSQELKTTLDIKPYTTETAEAEAEKVKQRIRSFSRAVKAVTVQAGEDWKQRATDLAQAHLSLPFNPR